jgi:Cu/Ag efflux protein CusF
MAATLKARRISADKFEHHSSLITLFERRKLMSLFSTIRIAVLTALVFVAITATASAAQEAIKSIAETESVTVKATIEAIDKNTRMVTLKGPKGNSVAVYADESVKRFNDLKVGDEVTATYSESVAVSVRKPSEAAPPKKTESVTARQGKPGATATVQQTITVSVEEIDRPAKTVTVKGPEGRVHTCRVRDVKNLQGVKVGDKVDISFTQALLLKVDPPATK